MKGIITIALCLIIPATILSQALENREINKLVARFKTDPKGPYKDIRWFCKDGTTRPPQERCPEPGNQRARYKDEIVSLGKTNHVFLGQILATTDFEEFWDKDHYNSRLKQYQLESYLKRTDNGWILRKAQYYRGAVQAEDEESWGSDFFKWLLADDKNVKQHYFLIREAARDIPHQGDDSKTQKIRALSKEISDSVPAFMNIRIKIHGQPEPADLPSVREFRSANKSRISSGLEDKLEELIKVMELYYQPVDLNALNKYLNQLPKGSQLYQSVKSLIGQYTDLSPKSRVIQVGGLLWQVREATPLMETAQGRLALFDLSLTLEEILFRDAERWEVNTPGELMQKIQSLGLAAAGCGYLEAWEWEQVHNDLTVPLTPSCSLGELNRFFGTARRMIEWGAGMYRGAYKDVVELYGGFEPLSSGFIDDKVRTSILLPLGDNTGDLGEYIGREAGLSNQVLDLKGQSQIRGLNPGVALGELVVINEITAETVISGDKIYVFNHPPSDLKPVAGIATITEGNMVSHVQLLARNLAIPNAVISADNLEQLKQYQGRKVFYAVSNKGTVIMKAAEQMTPEEKKLFENKKRNDERITVPVDRLNLEQTDVIDLRDVNAGHSGILCGPKAANLGQLKLMFPDHVVEGLVIPFGIFRQHMDQVIPGRQVTYWEFLNEAFDKTSTMREQGKTEEEIETALLGDLETLRTEIFKMPMIPEFINDLSQSFRNILGKEIGTIPVFLRSDTNMEDLKDFTGAGLNLTLFNVLDREKIIQGIKDVWASPYSERSYKWRQRYLLNPQNVFPSILIIPSVNVESSGVLITKGILSGQEDDLTIAFSRGAGGAVEGQAAESYLLAPGGENLLLSPSREPYFNTLPASGGILKKSTTFQKPVLSNNQLAALRDVAEKIKFKMRTASVENPAGPYDIELGFTGDTLWLFQIRPFVENKNASRVDYLKSISPDLPENKNIHLKSTL